MNVYCIYYDFAQQGADHYGFVASKLVSYKDAPSEVLEEVAELTHHKPSIRDRAKYYCATVSTPYDGQSARLVAKLIEQLGEKEVRELDEWERIVDIHNLEAYRLNQVQDMGAVKDR